jgi:hypothetical protein
MHGPIAPGLTPPAMDDPQPQSAPTPPPTKRYQLTIHGTVRCDDGGPVPPTLQIVTRDAHAPADPLDDGMCEPLPINDVTRRDDGSVEFSVTWWIGRRKPGAPAVSLPAESEGRLKVAGGANPRSVEGRGGYHDAVVPWPCGFAGGRCPAFGPISGPHRAESGHGVPGAPVRTGGSHPRLL